MHDRETFETTVRRAFLRLTRQDLPAAALARGWPVRTPEAFESLLIGHLSSAHSEPKPAEPCVVDLVLAVELGERLLSGDLCCVKMRRRLLREAAKDDPRRAEAFRSLLEVLSGNG